MLPSVESDAIVRAWNYTPMRFWQNQLNFAVWCATTGCGVSYKDHLSGDISEFAKSMFIFHVYCQIRRILFELKAPLPTAQSWNAFDNSFDAKSYEQICPDFNVDKNTDWRLKLDANGAFGLIFNYVTCTRYQPLKGISYDANKMTFTQYNVGKLHIDYISQQHRDAWFYKIRCRAYQWINPHILLGNPRFSISDQIRYPRCRQRIWCAEAVSCQHWRRNPKSNRFAQPDYPISKRTQIRTPHGWLCLRLWIIPDTQWYGIANTNNRRL